MPFVMPFVRATSKVYLAFIFLCILYYHYYGIQFWITQVEPEMCNREDISLKSIRFHNAKHLDFTTRFTSHLYDTLFTSDDSEIDFHCNTRFKYTDLVNEILMKDESEDLLTSEIDHPSFLSYNFDQYEGSGFIKSKLFEMIKTFIGQRVTIKSEFYQKNSTDGKTERFLSHHIYSDDQYWWRTDPLIVVSKCSEEGCAYGESYHAINSSSLSREVMHASVEMKKTEGFVSFKNLTIPVVLNIEYENVDPAHADIILSITEGEIMNYTSLFYFSFIWILIALIPNYPRSFIRSPSFNSFIQILNVKNISDRYEYDTQRYSLIQKTFRAFSNSLTVISMLIIGLKVNSIITQSYWQSILVMWLLSMLYIKSVSSLFMTIDLITNSVRVLFILFLCTAFSIPNPNNIQGHLKTINESLKLLGSMVTLIFGFLTLILICEHKQLPSYHPLLEYYNRI